MGHRVAPDPLVDRLALQHLALGPGEQLQQLELAPGQVEAVAADEGLELVGADLQLGGDQRARFGLAAAAAAAAGDRFDPRHRLLGMAGLGDPVVDAEAQPADPLGDGRAAGADDHAEVGEHLADALEVVPAFVAEDRRVEQHRVQLHRHQLLRRDRAGRVAQLPAGDLRPFGKDGDEAAVGVDDGEPDGLVWVQSSAAPIGVVGARNGKARRLYAHRNHESPAFTGFSQVGRVEIPTKVAPRTAGTTRWRWPARFAAPAPALAVDFRS